MDGKGEGPSKGVSSLRGEVLVPLRQGNASGRHHGFRGGIASTTTASMPESHLPCVRDTHARSAKVMAEKSLLPRWVRRPLSRPCRRLPPRKALSVRSPSQCTGFRHTSSIGSGTRKVLLRRPPSTMVRSRWRFHGPCPVAMLPSPSPCVSDFGVRRSRPERMPSLEPRPSWPARFACAHVRPSRSLIRHPLRSDGGDRSTGRIAVRPAVRSIRTVPYRPPPSSPVRDDTARSDPSPSPCAPRDVPPLRPNVTSKLTRPSEGTSTDRSRLGSATMDATKGASKKRIPVTVRGNKEGDGV